MKLNVFTCCLFLFLCLHFAGAQPRDPFDIAVDHVQAGLDKWGLKAQDIAEMTLSNRYRTAHNGVTHLYFIQRHQGIEIHTAIMGVHIKPNGEVGYAAHRFVPGAAGKVNAVQPLLTPQQAIEIAAAHAEAPAPGPLRRMDRPEANIHVYEGGPAARSNITVKLVYQIMRSQDNLRLAWHVMMDPVHTADWWSMRIDALDGEVLEKNNWTLYCALDDDEEPHPHGLHCLHSADIQERLHDPGAFTASGARYNVFPLPVESPIHGSRQLATDPADPVASPWGWHDTNGAPGPEYTITRGNNAHAYPDLNNDNVSLGGEPDGGSALHFDFPFAPGAAPDQLREASIVNLFYVSNMMHDIFYHYGFDEEAGNFQHNNYGNGGLGEDAVQLEAQDGGNVNNANFATPPDGTPPRMQMYLWRRVTGDFVSVTGPAELAGMYNASIALFGPELSQAPVEGAVAPAFDGSSQPDLACGTIINPAQVAGKIAFIRRGECSFKEKVRNAEAAGAIAVIICNTLENNTVLANNPLVTDPIGIPVVMMRNSDCQRLRLALAAGQTVSARLQLPAGFDNSILDSSFDNGIIAHEYAHGISNRLTGGPSQADCLFNGEQMGEGWSDFFTLITTARPGDSGAMARGIGNYATRRPADGVGIRRLPYSTNPAVNLQTFDDIIGTTSPHQLGEIWAGVIWDLYWRLVDEYGWDEDIINGNGGNNIAIRLVMDGMKLQNCLPGFIDGRDAIFAADRINYDGAHECLIWEVFARRGLGWSASQNDNFNRNDGVQAFDVKPQCVAELKIAKSLTPLIEAGDQITAVLNVVNHKETAATGVTITDRIPAGAEFVNGSVSGVNDFSVNGDVITFFLDNMGPGAQRTVAYRMLSSPHIRSAYRFSDDMEAGDANWETESLTGEERWRRTGGLSAGGQFAWYVPSTDNRNDQVLLLREPVNVAGVQPVMRFTHRYATESGIDGGIVQISTDGGANWEQPDPYVFRNGYRGRIAFATFSLPATNGFWGNSSGFVTTWFDLSPYSGQQIRIRFRFGTNQQSPFIPEQGLGWIIDDFEILDMFNYNSEACVFSNQGDIACAEAPGRGAIVQPGLTTSVSEVSREALDVEVFPNPAGNVIHMAFHLDRGGRVVLHLLNADGRMIAERSYHLGAGAQLLPLDIREAPGGLYFLRIHTEDACAVRKVVKR